MQIYATCFFFANTDLFIRALLLDRILVLEKTTPTPRVHLVSYNCMRPNPIALHPANLDIGNTYTPILLLNPLYVNAMN